MLMNINKAVIKMQGHSRMDAGAAFGALGTRREGVGGEEHPFQADFNSVQ